jgi:DNA mismatch endonuclease (patch repair protein)
VLTAHFTVPFRDEVSQMTDKLTPEKRSAIMSSIRAKNTRPELFVRHTIHSMGVRFRLHVRSLPGCPDIVMPKYSTILQVKGCFWHLHRCLNGRLPRTNSDYWIPKLDYNKKRDIRNERKLRRLGWRVKTIWECQLAKMTAAELGIRLERLLCST